MNFNWQKNLLQSIIFSTLLASIPTVLAQTFDYSLLEGEWSEPGMCDKKRFVYAADGSYILKEKTAGDSNWQTVYEAIYVINPQANTVTIAEGDQQDGFTFSTTELTEQTYITKEVTSELLFEQAEEKQEQVFQYEKCAAF